MAELKILRDYLHFLWAGLARHSQTGGLLPSQRFLVNAMIAPVPRDYRGQVVELGTGNGNLTTRLAARCPNARILACEINPVLAEDARQNLAKAGENGRVQVHAVNAQKLLARFAAQAEEKPDYLISGIPLGNLGREKVVDLLQAIGNALPEKGMFIQFQHSLLDRRHIRTVFRCVRTVPVLLNLPPAFVYYAQKQE